MNGDMNCWARRYDCERDAEVRHVANLTDMANPDVASPEALANPSDVVSNPDVVKQACNITCEYQRFLALVDLRSAGWAESGYERPKLAQGEARPAAMPAWANRLAMDVVGPMWLDTVACRFEWLAQRKNHPEIAPCPR